MAAIIWNDVTAIAPEQASVSASAQADYLGLANAPTGLDPRVFDGEDGPRTKLARCYLAAHLAALAAQGSSGAAGPVTQEQVGAVMRQYAIMGAHTYSDTGYGRALMTLISTGRAAGFWVL